MSPPQRSASAPAPAATPPTASSGLVSHPDRGSVVLPDATVQRFAHDPLTAELYPTRLGCFPQAAGHQIVRLAAEAHDWLCMVCYGGHGEVHCCDWHFTLQPGQACLLPAGLPHAYSSDDEHPWSLYWVHMNGSQMAAFAAVLTPGQGAPRFTADLAAARREFLPLLREAERTVAWDDLRLLANRLRALLLALRRPADPTALAGGLDLAAIHAYMDAQLSQVVDLGDLAALAGLSRYHFCRRYKAATGLTPIDSLIQRRMRRACELLDAGPERIGDVARALGYRDTHYFSRIFRKTVGYSPRDYLRLATG